MGSFSLIHWVIIAAIVVLLFGAGRLSNVMGEFAKGIKAFRAGLREEDPPPPQIQHPAPPPPAQTASPERQEEKQKVG
ncbi:MAG TPA: twin-arginine translocase TatA/TatE family subunit [Stellaceae bacterium]|nr:twin-arginine translocase TatA/TatE family subunit [Stellaceae bacterium]